MGELPFLVSFTYFVSYILCSSDIRLETNKCFEKAEKLPNLITGKCTSGFSDEECTLFCYGISGFNFSQNATLAEVTAVTIYNSYINTLSVESFNVFPNIRTFICRFCDIKQIHYLTFVELLHLDNLSLSGEPLTLEVLESALCGLADSNKTMNFIKVYGFRREPGWEQKAKSLLRCLKHLKTITLDISFDIFDESDINDLVCRANWSKLVSLHLNYLTKETPFYLKNNTFECINKKSNSLLRNITLSNILFDSLNSSTFKQFSQIHQFKLVLYNLNFHLTQFTMFSYLDNLRNLSLVENGFRDFTVFTNASSDVLPHLEVLDIEQQYFSYLFPFKRTLPSLKHLILSDLSKGLYVFKNIPNHFIKDLVRIESLVINDINALHVSKNAFKSNSLTHLTISKFRTLILTMSPKVFQKAKKLSTLDLHNWNPNIQPTWNYYQDLNYFVSQAFQNLSQLKHIYLRGMWISEIRRNMFKGSNKLESIDLNGNKINEIDSGALSHLTNLQNLNVQNNDIKTIAEDMLPRSTFNGRKIGIRASFNSWLCDCSLMWFYSVIKSESKHFQIQDEQDRYRCSYPYKLWKTLLIDYKLDYNLCSGGFPILYSLMIHVSGGLCILSLIISMVYRLRWHIYYIYINGNAFRKRRKMMQEDTDNGRYEYDAFVAYNRMDTKWVVNVLRPTLEDIYGNRLCLHDRDWAAGVDIVDNIQSSIERSRKVVLVITNAFARSDWCQLELTMAQHQLFSSDKDNLILLIKEPVLDCFMTPRLALQMKSQTYIEWPESDMGQKVFWCRLVKAITAFSGSVKDKPTLFKSGL